MTAEEQVAIVRRFNRLVTQRAGALDDHFLGRDRPLGESRLLYEIGDAGADLRDLRRRLGLDAGYVSRLVGALEQKRLVKTKSDPRDQRVRTARLTAAGRREVREMSMRSDDAASDLLGALSAPQRDRLVAAMTEVQRLLLLAGLRIERVAPDSDDARECVRRYFAELDRRFDTGFDPQASLAAEDDALVPPRGAFLVASADGEALACGAVKAIAPGIASLKRMWVADDARGLGIGRRMLTALEEQARALGLATIRLETNRALDEAIALYRSAGYTETSPFNDEAYAHHWFEKTLR